MTLHPADIEAARVEIAVAQKRLERADAALNPETKGTDA